MNLPALKSYVPISLLLLGLLTVYLTGLHHYLTFESLSAHRGQLLQWTEQHFWWVLFGFSGIYIIAVALSIPGATLLTVTAGFLFGIPLALPLVVLSATLGACVIFLAVKTAFGEFLAKGAKGWVATLESGFRQNAFNYLLFLRFVPLFPFWVVNIVPALVNIPLRIFFIGTLLGIIPGTAVYVALGNGLGALFEAGEKPDLGIIFTPEILFPILGLGLLALLPIAYQKFKSQGKLHRD